MSLFKFKQFEVDQTGSTMRINTDGVLLGALSQYDHPQNILDIGTGTGVIALMLAQRYSQAMIDAVEIDEQAYLLASKNFAQSKFASRIEAHHASFEKLEPKNRYHLMVSNPPYFLNALKSKDMRKTKARHASFDFFEELLAFAVKWLHEEGRLQLILPVDIVERITKLARETFGLFHIASTFVKSFDDDSPIRQIAVLSKQYMCCKVDYFTIYKAKGVYTDAYKMLLKPFFLNY